MSRLYTRFSIILASLLLLVSVNIYAQDVNTTETTTTQTTQTASGPVTVEKHTVTTAVPAAKEVVATPTGYVSCSTVEAGWVNNVWLPAHRVCEYKNNPLGVNWIEGYWSCTQATDAGACTSWIWVAGHWVQANQ
ncbi:MAG: hypothetical protein WAW86_05145 [Gammaproteobacteria bacterium]